MPCKIMMQYLYVTCEYRKQCTPTTQHDQYYSEDILQKLTETGINEIIDNFTAAIIRSQKAGFDGVQLHMEHGYLLSGFLSSYSNSRTDKWGGSFENKYRIVHEFFLRARRLVSDFPILVKMNGYDGRKN